MPPPQRLQQLSTLHRRHVDVFDFCSNGEPSSARPLAILSTSADAFQWTTTSESAGSRAPFGLELCLQVVHEANEALATGGVSSEGHGNGYHSQNERELRSEHA